MKLHEVLAPRYTIAVDLDGTVCDFITTANKITGMKMKEGDLDALDKQTSTDFWNKIIDHVKAGNPFFSAMKPLPDAKQLWSYVTYHPHFVLTAAGKRIPGAEAEKRLWVKKYLGMGTRVEVVESAAAKARFATPYTILIDDREKAITPWIAAGGIGILHKNAAQTIAELKKLGL